MVYRPLCHALIILAILPMEAETMTRRLTIPRRVKVDPATLPP